MTRMLLLLIAAAALAACTEAPATRAVCPASELAGLVGQPVLELAANDRLRPMRLVRAGDTVRDERPERLTVRADGQGRVAGLSCG